MKIGIDARNLVPGMTGIGRYVFEMCRHLSFKGHELFLYLPENPASSLPDWPRTSLRIGNHPGGILRMVWGQSVLPKLAAEDAIEVFWGPAHRLPSSLDKRIPRIVTIHDLVWKKAPSTMRSQTWLAESILMKPAIRHADQIVADSKSTAEDLRKYFPEAGAKTKVIYPGRSEIASNCSDFLHFARKLEIDRPYLLFVGTLEPRKNLPRLLKAFSMLPEATRKKLLLVIAGGQGWHLTNLTELITELGIKPSVRLTGYVKDSELAGLYTNAHFLIMPSIYEGFGFPIIEANAAGIPVLTSNCSSMPEVAGDAAILTDPNNTRLIADSIMHLLNDAALYKRLKSRARPNAERFDWNQSANMLLDTFQEAIEMRRR
ncbi:glycosyltransferase family 1 protein [Ochrobactrum sp. WV_118_8]